MKKIEGIFLENERKLEAREDEITKNIWRNYLFQKFKKNINGNSAKIWWKLEENFTGDYAIFNGNMRK